MEKIGKKIKKIILVLFVVLISIIAFVGIFQKENGVWENILSDFECGMDIEGARELKYAVDTSEVEKYVYVDENGNIKGEVLKDGTAVTAEDEASETTEEGQAESVNSEQIPYAKETRIIKANSDDKLTKENFEKTKKVIQERLKNQNLQECNIRIDDVTGKMVIENANDNKQVELIEQLVGTSGKFQIIDYQNGVVLMENSDIKNASVVYSTDMSYNSYLNIQFDEEGTEKLKEISKKYIQIEEHKEGEEVLETEEHEHEHEIKYVSVVFDDTTMMTTYFAEEMPNGILQIAVGQATSDYEEFLKNNNSAQTIANILNSGMLPIKYQLETDYFVKSEIASQNFDVVKIGIIAAVAVFSIIIIIKFKKNGFMVAISAIGYISILSIILRYANVTITQNSIIMAAIIVFANYVFLKMILVELKKSDISEAYKNASKKFYFGIVPIFVIAIVFTFASNYVLSSMGMVAFWGLILNIIYNILITKTLLEK